jgi:hypothetical protein
MVLVSGDGNDNDGLPSFRGAVEQVPHQPTAAPCIP